MKNIKEEDRVAGEHGEGLKQIVPQNGMVGGIESLRQEVRKERQSYHFYFTEK